MFRALSNYNWFPRSFCNG